ncbi:uncharacterized protein LOC106085716 isoform X1 [Stomoxys calcitrans]|uniref:uncharacterized protein LOC106085716 isoform X1 n=2 Tax=Stomoxys calcitrans TaxID=35570 RepID=UPI0027E2FA70|nr:uncharacterized protein LOC106085716 isoform X1 [Stomoxys calcitrans]
MILAMTTTTPAAQHVWKTLVAENMDSNNQLLQLLKELQGEIFYQIFADCQVNVTSLKFMGSQHLDQLIPKNLFGPRIIFEHYLKEWQEKQTAVVKPKDPLEAAVETQVERKPRAIPKLILPKLTTTTTTNEPESIVNDSIEIFNSMPPKTEIIMEDTETMDSSYPSEPWPSQPDDDDYTNDSSLLEPLPSTSTKRSEPYDTGVKLTVIDILKQSFNGKQVLTYYEKNSILTPKMRVLLATSLVEYLVEKKIIPKRENIEAMAENIVKCFKTEDKDIYYVPPERGKKPGGILYLKYYNYAKKLKKVGCYDMMEYAKPSIKFSLDEEANSEEPNPILFTPLCKSVFDLKLPVAKILSKSYDGRQLLNHYEKHDNLTQKHSYMVSACIINYMFENEIRAKPEDFEVIADNIIQLFPNESKETYYSKERGKKPGGILFRKYHNTISQLKRKGLEVIAMTQCKKQRLSAPAINETDQQAEDRLWLQQYLKPMDEIMQKWKSTHVIRLAFIEQNNLSKILEEWPLYRQTFGHKLIEMDFSMESPETANNLHTRWEHFSNVLMCLLKDVVDHEIVEMLKDFYGTQHDQEVNNCIIFYAIHYIIKPTARIITHDPVTKERKNNKVSMQESRNSFMILCQTQKDLQSAIAKMKSDSDSNNEAFPPIIGCVGDSIFHITEYYVFYDEVCYEFNDILSCVDAAFKVFHILKIDYPKQCKSVWYFIQDYFFDIKLPNCEKTSSLTGLFHNLKVISV